jgi:hypothetical protein
MENVFKIRATGTEQTGIAVMLYIRIWGVLHSNLGGGDSHCD